MFYTVGQSHGVQIMFGPVLGFVQIRSRNDERHGDVFQCVELWKEVVELVDETDHLVAQASTGPVSHLAYDLVADDELAGGGSIEKAENVQKSRLSGAAWTNKRRYFASAQAEIEFLLIVKVAVALPVCFFQTLNGQEDIALSYRAFSYLLEAIVVILVRVGEIPDFFLHADFRAAFNRFKRIAVTRKNAGECS